MAAAGAWLAYLARRCRPLKVDCGKCLRNIDGPVALPEAPAGVAGGAVRVDAKRAVSALIQWSLSSPKIASGSGRPSRCECLRSWSPECGSCLAHRNFVAAVPRIERGRVIRNCKAATLASAPSTSFALTRGAVRSEAAAGARRPGAGTAWGRRHF